VTRHGRRTVAVAAAATALLASVAACGSADDQRVQMVRRLAAEDDSMDILGLDGTWTQEFASAEWILEWTGAHKAEAERGTLAGPLRSAQFEGKLFAASKNTNVQLLWYRADLYNTLTESAGGHIVNEAGTEAVIDAGAVQALRLLHRFATAGVTSPSFSNAIEDDARLEFQAGGGAFQLNWPYVYAAMQQDAPRLADDVHWARYPRVEPDIPGRVTIGGYNLAVSAYSEHPREAFEAALCLRGAEHQKYSAIHSGVPPTIESVYDDPELARAYPMKDVILAELRDAAVRPRTPAYQNVSTVMSAILSPPSSIEPAQTAERLRDELEDALESRGVLP
jgi:multiple sugar transport system substrate-binding protein